MKNSTITEGKAPAFDEGRLKILLDNYRESRAEGIGLVHSFFRDVPTIVGLISAVIAGNFAGKPQVLFLMPLALEGIVFYALAKFKANNLVTSYLVFLEGQINALVDDDIMIWNTVMISSHLSAGRGKGSGNGLLLIGSVIITLLIGGTMSWAVYSNPIVLVLYWYIFSGWFVATCVLYLLCLIMLYVAQHKIRECTPDKIEAAINSLRA